MAPKYLMYYDYEQKNRLNRSAWSDTELLRNWSSYIYLFLVSVMVF